MIKEALLSLLANENSQVYSSAAECVAAIGVVEVQMGQWQDLINIMFDAATKRPEYNIRMSALLTIRYFCEDIPPTCLSDNQLNCILGAVLENIIFD